MTGRSNNRFTFGKAWLFLGLLLPALVFGADYLPLRIVAGNLTSGRFQNYDDGAGARIFQGLKPDIALIQEFRSGTNTKREIDSWVRSVFGPEFSYYREDKELPNGIVSRYPILSSGVWPDEEMPNRDFAWARIALPRGPTLFVVSVHLSASKETKRRAQTAALADYCRKNVPPGDWLVIGGDYNTQVRGESCLRSLEKWLVIRPPWPADEDGNENTNRNRRKPTDWVLVGKELHACSTPNTLTWSGDLVFDSRVFRNLDLVPPVLIEDSDAEQMQHMAVLRDFWIPIAPAAPAPLPEVSPK